MSLGWACLFNCLGLVVLLWISFGLCFVQLGVCLFGIRLVCRGFDFEFCLMFDCV